MNDPDNSTSEHHDDTTHNDDEEEECRVCRGPAEEGHPLFHPCKCSGSIGKVHQDCLMSWLQMRTGARPPTNSVGSWQSSCELCQAPLVFNPLYDSEAPQQLPWYIVVQQLFHVAATTTLPWLARCAVVVLLWLGVVPLVTARLYQWAIATTNRQAVAADGTTGDDASTTVDRVFVWGPFSFLRWMWKPLFNATAATVTTTATTNATASEATSSSWWPTSFFLKFTPQEWTSGLLISAWIILSFLSLLSFTDFLRMEWQRQQAPIGRPRGANNRRGQRDADVPRHGLFVGPGPDANVDDSVWEYCQEVRVLQQRERDQPQQPQPNVDESNHSQQEVAFADLDLDDDDEEDDSWEDEEDDSEEEDDDLFGEFVDMPPLEPAAGGGGNANRNDPPDAFPNVGAAMNANANNQRVLNMMDEAAAAMDDDLNNFDGDMNGGNIALDEMVGLRGPLVNVFRHSCWLLAFFAVYLALFAFTPRLVGTAVGSLLPFSMSGSSNVTSSPNKTDVFVFPKPEADDLKNATTSSSYWSRVVNVLQAVVEEGDRQGATIRLPDVYAILLGYFSCAVMVGLFWCLWTLGKRVRVYPANRNAQQQQPGRGRGAAEQAFGFGFRVGFGDPVVDDRPPRVGHDELNRMLVQGGLGDLVDDPLFNPARDDDDVLLGIPLSMAIEVALDVMLAIVKVGVLLFMKMFMLPMALGLYLDYASITLLRGSLDGRIAYAGQDLFSFVLLHWVAGITFMLLVTVSVLQLREVTHPELLAQVIRPQEPQPDLLGNLMHETMSTHTKRLVLSLIIYAVLLTMHVYIPVRGVVALAGGLGIELKFWYAIMPQLQVPLELLLFHLSMLSLLERHKNSIGEMQHHWLKFLSRHMGMDDCLLPKEVESFRLLGTRSVFADPSAEDEVNLGSTVDQFWYDLALNSATYRQLGKKQREELIEKSLDTLQPPDDTSPLYNAGETKPNGERVLLAGSDFIRLPVGLPTGRRQRRAQSKLLPTTVGRFRLKRDTFASYDNPQIQIWEEVPGELIPRPPEGWDDLGGGGADVQGRWAWGREKRSTIEGGVARRHKFYLKGQSRLQSFAVSFKLITILGLSWLATTALLATIMFTPLFIGRFLYYVLRVPDKWIHDPFGYGVGYILFFPMFRVLTQKVLLIDTPIATRLVTWLRRFHLPPVRKATVLLTAAVVWFGVAPLLLGFLYDIAFLKSSAWFMGDELPWISKETVLLSLATGNVSLFVWSNICRLGVFTRQFWWVLAAGGGEPLMQPDGVAPLGGANEGRNIHAADGDARAAAWVAAGGNRVRLTWQGKHGRMQRFYDVWKSVLLDWEWDKVDSTVLLRDCALPVAAELFWTLFFPVVAWALCFWYLPFLQGFSRVVFVRTVLASACCVQVSRVWKKELQAWGKTLHRIARDDRYLIGTILKNYEEPTPNPRKRGRE